MSKVMIFLGNGYEEVEALTVVDVLRRGGVEIDMVSITGKLETIGDHNIRIMADKLLEEIDLTEYDGVVTPGGLKGTEMLRSNDKVVKIMKMFFDEKKLVASICASPLVLEEAKIACKIEGTMYPGLESKVDFMKFVEEPVHVYNNVITARGPATAFFFAYEILNYLEGKEKTKIVKNATLSQYIQA